MLEKDVLDQFTTDLKNCSNRELWKMLKRITNELEEREEV